MKYRDFNREIRALHERIVQEIVNMMQEHGVDEVDLAGSSADHAYIIGVPDFDWDCDYMEAEVLKVYVENGRLVMDVNWDIDSEVLAESNENGDIGDAYTDVTATDYEKIKPCCGIDMVYESVYEVLELNK